MKRIRATPISRLRGNYQTTQKGFTLPELLVASIIAALIAGITAQVMIGQLLEERRLESAQRVRENLSRLNYLIQIEASESDSIETGVSPPGCALGTDGFTLWVPRPGGVYGDPVNRSGIQYADNGNDILRCGPRVSRNGVLIHPPLGSDGGLTNVTGVVVRNATFNFDACPIAAAGREISYQVNFAGGAFGAPGIGECATAHSRSVFVCNPRLFTEAGVYVPDTGDCPP